MATKIFHTQPVCAETFIGRRWVIYYSMDISQLY